MIDDLVVVNLRPDGPEVPTAFTNLQWQTCLRRIVFLHRAELTLLPAQLDFEAYCGRDVYQFLLEVICGLHSPLLGENAVMGQFRKFRASAQFPNTVWGRFLRTLTTDLLVDARLVRHHHLQGLGSQSYGSLIRRYLKGRSSVAVLGAGSLAREILPWLTDVRVFYRNLHHASDLQDKHPHMQLEQFRMADAGWHGNSCSLVIAAPLDAAEINKWLALQNITFSTVLDLRGNADADPIRSRAVISLSELLTTLQDERKRIEHHVIAAQEEIESLTLQRFSERESKRADCKPQIQTHSATRVSAPLLEYRGLIFWSRYCQLGDSRLHLRSNILSASWGNGNRRSAESAEKPFQNPYAERFIGSLRRECLDHIIVFNEFSLRHILKAYFDYYEHSRTQLGLEKDAPESRAIQPREVGIVVELPQVGGLHHRYERRA